MNNIFKKAVMLAVGAVVFVADYTSPVHIGSIGEVSLIASAHARVGRPLTPVSYAGVARRTTRRVVATGAAVGAATAPVVVVAPTTQTCVDVVDAYGTITRRCQ